MKTRNGKSGVRGDRGIGYTAYPPETMGTTDGASGLGAHPGARWRRPRARCGRRRRRGPPRDRTTRFDARFPVPARPLHLRRVARRGRSRDDTASSRGPARRSVAAPARTVRAGRARRVHAADGARGVKHRVRLASGARAGGLFPSGPVGWGKSAAAQRPAGRVHRALRDAADSVGDVAEELGFIKIEDTFGIHARRERRAGVRVPEPIVFLAAWRLDGDAVVVPSRRRDRGATSGAVRGLASHRGQMPGRCSRTTRSSTSCKTQS